MLARFGLFRDRSRSLPLPDRIPDSRVGSCSSSAWEAAPCFPESHRDSSVTKPKSVSIICWDPCFSIAKRIDCGSPFVIRHFVSPSATRSCTTAFRFRTASWIAYSNAIPGRRRPASQPPEHPEWHRPAVALILCHVLRADRGQDAGENRPSHRDERADGVLDGTGLPLLAELHLKVLSHRRRGSYAQPSRGEWTVRARSHGGDPQLQPAPPSRVLRLLIPVPGPLAKAGVSNEDNGQTLAA
jgi:hypothetical protein